MPRLVRSARGELVDFDLIAIANQLAAAPVPVSINERRLFIDEKNGIKPPKQKPVVPSGPVHEALKLAAEAANIQRTSVDISQKEPEIKEGLKILEPDNKE
jgi:hypothetical protein